MANEEIRPENYDSLLHSVDKEWAENVRRSNGTSNPNLRPLSAIFKASTQTQTKREIIGTKPTCTCNAPFEPGVVLDPFAGSGTTLMVARQLGRSAIGIEISEEYAKLIKQRLNWGFDPNIEWKVD